MAHDHGHGGDPASWASHAREVLSDAGHRTGGAREAVVETLACQDCCLSAQEISEELRAKRGRVGLASVYRALDLLHGHGLVQRLDVGEGGARYERVSPHGDHHHHFVCERCGAVVAFEDEALERAIERLGARLRHSVHSHDVTIRGECPECAALR
jgi:Fur family ferric uptake transcriptional regulator